MHPEAEGHAGVDLFEEPEHFRAGVTFVQFGEHLTGSDVHRREQINGPVAFVVVSHRPGPSRLHRQRRLGPVQCLTLRLRGARAVLAAVEDCRL